MQSLWIAGAALAGLSLLFQLETLPSRYLLTTLALAHAGAAALIWRGLPHWHFRRPFACGLGLVFVALCFMLWGAIVSSDRLSNRLDPSDDGSVHVVVIQVEDLPQRVGHERLPPSWKFQARLIEGPRPGARANFTWSSSGGNEIPEDLLPGQRFELSARLRNAAGTRNFYGFDAETWMFSKSMLLSGSVQNGRGYRPPRERPPGHDLGSLIDRLRAHIRSVILATLAEAPHAGVMSGLVIGDQQGIPRESWSLFSRTGVSHLVSISGMHVTLFAVLARWLVTQIWRLASRPPLRLALYVPLPVAAAVGASLAAFAYALLAGFNIPAQRTAVMVSVAALSSLTGLRASSWGILSCTLLAILALDPTAPLSAGFWLSFFAVCILFGLPDAGSAWRSAVRAQLAISVGLAPLTIALFQQVSLVGPLANALAIPVVTFLVTPLAMGGSLLAMVGLPDPLVWGHRVFEWLYSFLNWCGALSWASLSWAAPPVWASILACSGALVALQSSFGVWRHACWMAILALWVGGEPAPPSGEFHALFLDIGQGTSVLVRTQNESLVFDTGPSLGRDTAGQRIVAPQLQAMGLTQLSALVVSHQDDDHASGLADLTTRFRPRWLLTSLSEATTRGRLESVSHRPSYVPCETGVSWSWDGVLFRFVSPFRDDPAPQDKRATNPDGCVLEVRDARGRALLLTADIPESREREILERQPWLRPDPLVLYVPHHGSKTSSSDELLGLSPRAAVVQSAYRGRFRHPHPEVVDRYAQAGIPLYRSDLLGALRLRWADDQPLFESAARTTSRFWHLSRDMLHQFNPFGR